ncbi:PTPRU-like protein, partial [Mya arenaria]
ACKPTDITNGNTLPLSPPSDLRVNCPNGYHPQPESVQCHHNGSWSSSPQCIWGCPWQIENGYLTDIYNHSILFNRPIQVNQYFSIICNDAYELNVTNNRFYCRNGTWNEDVKCEPIECSCPAETDIAFYMVIATTNQCRGSKLYETRLQVQCKPGYISPTEETTTCQRNNRWSPHSLNCEHVTCNDPPEIQNGFYAHSEQGPYHVNAFVTPQCNTGYKLTGKGNSLTCSSDGNWSGIYSSCKLVTCSKPPVPVHGTYEPAHIGQYFYNTTINIICNIGYTIYTGPSMRLCTAEGHWSGFNQCEKVTCSINISENNHDGFTSKFEHIPRKCKLDGHLSGHEPICTRKACIAVNYLEVNISGYTVQVNGPLLYEETKMVEYNHSLFYHVNGSLSVNCSVDGTLQWQQGDPPDLRKICILPKTISNGMVNHSCISGDKCEHGTTLRIVCDEGFSPANILVKCLPSHTWNTDLFCEKMSTSETRIVAIASATSVGTLLIVADIIRPERILRLKMKCIQYWPEADKVDFDDYKTGEEKRKLFHFHFTAWPDKSVPKYASSLVHFRHKVETTAVKENGPVIVHCSAGVGRTGTFIALNVLTEQASTVGYVDPVGCVNTLRRQRVDMVQTPDQYIFLHMALLETLMLSTSALSASRFLESYEELMAVDNDHRRRTIDVEFSRMEKMSPVANKCKYVSEKDVRNRTKNRYSNILPVADHMPYLTPSGKRSEPDYINAVLLPNYKKKGAFIITQTPLEVTKTDFWRLVVEHDVHTIVMMNNSNEMKEDEIYWPVHEESETYENMKIIKTSEECEGGLRKITKLQQIQFENWPVDSALPSSPKDVLNLLDAVQYWQHQSGNNAVLVHCISGLFCVASAVLERMKIEQDVAITQVIKEMRNYREQLIPSVEQFQFVHEVVTEYILQHETYSNFTY